MAKAIGIFFMLAAIVVAAFWIGYSSASYDSEPAHLSGLCESFESVWIDQLQHAAYDGLPLAEGHMVKPDNLTTEDNYLRAQAAKELYELEGCA